MNTVIRLYIYIPSNKVPPPLPYQTKNKLFIHIHKIVKMYYSKKIQECESQHVDAHSITVLILWCIHFIHAYIIIIYIYI